MTVEGATSPEDYVRLMRDVCLRDVRALLPNSEAEWQRLGQLAHDHDLSGRNVDAICGNVRARIQDFEYPDEYFEASATQRRALVRELSTPATADQISQEIGNFAAFQLEATRLEEEKQFERSVDEMVRQLNAGKAAAAHLATDGLSRD